MNIRSNINVNFNPFLAPYQSAPSVDKNNGTVFSLNATPVNSIGNESSINALDLKDNLLAKFLPNNFIAKYSENGFIKKQVEKNPKIKELLAKKGLDVKVNIQNFLGITNSHLVPTYNYAKLIMEKSGINFSPEDYSIMEQAALLHDIGKIFIPAEILNKKEGLTASEREIIELHDSLGVELLKGSQLSPKVLTLIGAHHNYDGNEDNGLLTQILKVADVYSALKENRAYKNSMNDDKTFEVLYQKAMNKEFSIELVDVLKQAVKKDELVPKFTVA